MDNSVIRYNDDEAFYKGIIELTKAGIIFKARHSALEIELTGAY